MKCFQVAPYPLRWIAQELVPLKFDLVDLESTWKILVVQFEIDFRKKRKFQTCYPSMKVVVVVPFAIELVAVVVVAQFVIDLQVNYPSKTVALVHLLFDFPSSCKTLVVVAVVAVQYLTCFLKETVLPLVVVDFLTSCKKVVVVVGVDLYQTIQIAKKLE